MNDEEELTVFPLPLWIVILIVAFCCPSIVFSAPIVQATVQNVTITVYDEPCTHPEFVSNLPNRATWKEGDKVYDGCVGASPQLGMAMFWFTDKTMVVLPINMFSKVTSA